jgi:hypothetical protein
VHETIHGLDPQDRWSGKDGWARAILRLRPLPLFLEPGDGSKRWWAALVADSSPRETWPVTERPIETNSSETNYAQ